MEPEERFKAAKDQLLHRMLDEIHAIQAELSAQLPGNPRTKSVTMGYTGKGSPALVVTLEYAELLSWRPPFEEFRGVPVIWRMEGAPVS